MDWLFEIGRQYGVTAMIVAFMIWDGRSREQKYIAIIATLTEDVKDRLTKIEATLRRKP